VSDPKYSEILALGISANTGLRDETTSSALNLNIVCNIRLVNQTAKVVLGSMFQLWGFLNFS
jgi:hypothetical protein